MPLVSVVVPTYNRAYCLPRAIDSALAQSHREIEVIVVDDGSTDGTAAMMAERYGADSRVRYLRQDNAGVSAARNAGLRAAKGDYIGLLDSDDYWMPWKCEAQVRCLEAFPEAGMIWTDMEAVGPSGEVLSVRYLKQMYSAYGEIPGGELFSTYRGLGSIWAHASAALSSASVACGDIFSMMILGNLVHTSTVLLTRQRLEKVLGFREDLRFSGEDYDFHLRTCREGQVAFLDVPSIQYQVGRADQLSNLRLWVSWNFLKTILPVIAQDRSRIALPDERLKTLLADAYAWAGEEMCKARMPEARIHLWKSLRLRRGRRTAMLFAGTFIPRSMVPAVRYAYRSGKQIFLTSRAN